MIQTRKFVYFTLTLIQVFSLSGACRAPIKSQLEVQQVLPKPPKAHASEVLLELKSEDAVHINFEKSMPFQDAVRQTLATHPDVESARETVEATKALSTSFWQEYLPKLYAYVDAEKSVIPNKQVVPEGARNYVLHTSAGIVTRVWDGFKNWYLKQQAEYQAQSQEFMKIATENDLGVKVTEAYATLFLAQEQIILLKFMQENEQKLLKLVEEDRDTEGKKKAVLELIQMDLQSLEGEIFQANSRLKEQKNFYISVVGDSSVKQSVIRLDDIDVIDQQIKIPGSDQEAISMLESENPEFQSALAEIEVARKQKDVEKADYLGTVDFYVARTKTMGNGDMENPAFSDGTQLALQYNLQLGAPTGSRVASQEHTVGAKVANRNSLMRRLTLEVSNGYVKLDELTKANESQKVAYQQNKENLDIALEKIRSDRYDIDDLQTAFRLIDKLEPNKMKFLATSVEILLAKATIASKLGFFSRF